MVRTHVRDDFFPPLWQIRKPQIEYKFKLFWSLDPPKGVFISKNLFTGFWEWRTFGIDKYQLDENVVAPKRAECRTSNLFIFRVELRWQFSMLYSKDWCTRLALKIFNFERTGFLSPLDVKKDAQQLSSASSFQVFSLGFKFSKEFKPLSAKLSYPQFTWIIFFNFRVAWLEVRLA